MVVMEDGVGARLKALRKRRGLTQGQVAEYAGISQSTLSEIERGEIAPKTIDAIVNLTHYFGTTADYLLGLSDDPSPRRDAPLPEVTRSLLEILDELSEGRRAELLAHARVLYEAEQAVSVREYRRMRAVAVRMPDGKRMAKVLDDALRAGSSGDLAAALAVVDAYLAELAAGDTLEEDGEQV